MLFKWHLLHILKGVGRLEKTPKPLKRHEAELASVSAERRAPSRSRAPRERKQWSAHVTAAEKTRVFPCGSICN